MQSALSMPGNSNHIDKCIQPVVSSHLLSLWHRQRVGWGRKLSVWTLELSVLCILKGLCEGKHLGVAHQTYIAMIRFLLEVCPSLGYSLRSFHL